MNKIGKKIGISTLLLLIFLFTAFQLGWIHTTTLIPLVENSTIPYEDSKLQIEFNLKQEKEQAFVLQYLESLREQATIGSSSLGVLEVNGQILLEEDLDPYLKKITQYSQQQGVTTNTSFNETSVRTNAIAQLLDMTLLLQSAEIQGITLTDTEISESYEMVLEEIGGQEALSKKLKEMETTPQAFNIEIEQAMTVSRLVEKILDDAQISVTENEIRKVYNDTVPRE